MKHEKSVRTLHLLLMLTVIVQLLSEQFMQVPKPGEPINQVAALIFSLHQVVGIVVLIISATYLVMVIDREESKLRLFPWLDKKLRSSLIAETVRDIPGWFRGILPPPTQVHLVAGTVHGLGLLLATGLGVTGSIIYLGIEDDGSMSKPLHAMKDFHEVLGTTMWVFVLGHLLMALLHQIKGHNTLQSMFTDGGGNQEG